MPSSQWVMRTWSTSLNSAKAFIFTLPQSMSTTASATASASSGFQCGSTAEASDAEVAKPFVSAVATGSCFSGMMHLLQVPKSNV